MNATVSSQKLAITPVKRHIIRLSIYPKNITEPPKTFFNGPELANRNWNNPTQVLPLPCETQVTVDEFSISISQDPTLITIKRNTREIQRLALDVNKLRFDLHNCTLYGLGQGYHSPLDRRGSIYDLSVTGSQQGTLENGSVITGIPYLIGTSGWGIFVRSPRECIFNLNRNSISLSDISRSIKAILHETKKLNTEEITTTTEQKIDSPWLYTSSGLEGYCEHQNGDSWDVFIIDGAKLTDLVTGYYELTGRPPLPPKYAFGYQQSHRTLIHNGTNFQKSTANFFRKSGFPCDMLIYLSSGLADNGWNLGLGNFEFNQTVFPNPAKDIAELQANHFKICLHTHQCPPGLHGTIHESSVAEEDEAHTQNYWQKHEQVLQEAPVDGWWPDSCDYLTIESRLSRHRMYREGSLQRNPNIRPFALHRNGYAGMTQWGGIIWSGDNNSEWKTLENQIQIGLNVSVSLSPYWCTDIGGFCPTKEFDGELYIRWFQYSVFTPFLRSHGRPSWLHAPDGWNRFKPSEIPGEVVKGHYSKSQETIREEVSPDPEVEPICRKFAELRYRLLPYIYSLAHQTYSNGIPLMRPMWLSYGAEHWFSAAEDQYMFGDSLLIAPVFHKAARARMVALPDGVWFGLLDGKQYQGGTQVVIETPLESIPVLVPAGSIIPLANKKLYVDEAGHTDSHGFEVLNLLIYPGADAEFTLYEDDGISLDYERNIFRITTIKWNESTKTLSSKGVTSMNDHPERLLTAKLMPSGKRLDHLCTYIRI